jgi:hypothetical protein
MSGTHGWRWSEEQPGVIMVVVLVLAFALLFPHEACRGRSFVEPPGTTAPTAPANRSGFTAPADGPQ